MKTSQSKGEIMSDTLLATDDLKKHFGEKSLRNIISRQEADKVQAVDGVSLSIKENETHGVIGESGCGKSTLLETLMGLQKPTSGDIYYKGKAFSDFSRSDWKDYRRNTQIIFQDPFNALDPKMTVRETIEEPLQVHNLDYSTERLHEVLRQVELRPPERYINRLPDQLSGGEKQRAAIARALAVEPDLILADEPVSMLDVSTQASILQMLSRLVREEDISMVYISHDLSTVSYVCDIVNVMYLGRIVESGNTLDVIQNPKHPYTQALINAIPKLNPHQKRERTNMDGAPRTPKNIGEGCRFRERCPERMDICEKTPIDVEEDGQTVACHLYYEHEQLASGAIDGNQPNDGQEVDQL
jgi:peptide/nickel transport system ATP-binding protein